MEPEPGYAPDVTSYFEFPETAGSFLGCMDPVHHGKYLVGVLVSARSAHCKPSEDSPASFVFHRCQDVRIFVDAFAYSTPLKKGAWIVADRAEGLSVSDTKHTGDEPLMKFDAP